MNYSHHQTYSSEDSLQSHLSSQVKDTIHMKANNFLSRGFTKKAVKLYLYAGYVCDAAQALCEVAEATSKTNPLIAKKLFSLAACELKKYSMDTNTKMHKNTSFILHRAWRGVEANHNYILAHRHLYSGSMTDSMKPMIQCSEYKEILSSHGLASLAALAAYHFGSQDVRDQ